MHISPIEVHPEKTFLGLMPLFMLATIKALDPRSSRRWIPVAALLLLATLLYTASQFAYCLVALTLTAAAMLWRTGQRRETLRRALLLVPASAVVTALMVVALARVSADPRINVKLKDASINLEPDLAQFLVPSPYSAALGTPIYPGDRSESSVFQSKVSWLQSSEEWYGIGMDSVVTIYITVAILCIIGAVSDERKRARAWIAFALAFMVLSLGPRLRVLGEFRYGATKPFVMPYGVLTSRVPGFGFMRTPARFMLIGGIGLAIAAAIGLQYLRERFPARSGLILAAAVALLLVESWPRQWTQRQPPLVSGFYTAIASDPELYAVLDLAFEWPSSSLGSLYQYYQLTHRKPIALGYLSRSYKDYPVAAVNDLISGSVSGADVRKELAAAGYKYIVWHKVPEPPPGYEQFVKTFVDDQVPVFEDDLIRVYETLPKAAGS